MPKPIKPGATTEAAEVTLVEVNDDPILVTNTFSFTEGELLVLNDVQTGVINLQATDDTASAAELTYTISSDIVGGGFFDLDAEPITTFTQADLDTNSVVFEPDGSETTPAFNITLTDNEGSSIEVAAVVESFNLVNDEPMLINRTLTVTEGERPRSRKRTS